MKEKIADVIEYLNDKTGKKFRPDSKTTNRNVALRLDGGFTSEELKKVIDAKVADWQGTSMDKYIRPSTLFGQNFENYLNQKLIKGIHEVESDNKVAHRIDGYKEYLKTMRTIEYEDYGKTEHWKHFRKEALIFFGFKCQLCNKVDEEIHIHHKTYENRGRETFNDVIPLCKTCHRMVHGITNES